MTHGIICSNDYMDEDVAYLLGMLFGNGERIDQGTSRRLVITLAIRQRRPIELPGLDVAAMNERSLNQVRRRIQGLLDADVDVDAQSDTTATLSATFLRRSMAWRNIEMLCSRGKSRHSFLLPDVFFSMPAVIHEEFLRGFADAAVTPNKGDALPYGGKHRIAFPVVYSNKRFAKQLHKLLVTTGVTEEHQGFLSGEGAVRGGRPREHRLRVYPERYRHIGFSF